jgi:Chaperone of endosialidase
MNRSSRHCGMVAAVLIPLALACFALSPTVQATCLEGCSSNNTFLGDDALFSNTTGGLNTAIGVHALYFNTTGSANTAIGATALVQNTTGGSNTATGNGALTFNTSGFYNTANGAHALFFNTTGADNTATGFFALFSNTSGMNNAATGVAALRNNTTGNNNTAIGFNALDRCTRGDNNIAIGHDAGRAFNTRESNNIDIGNEGVAHEANTIRIGTSGNQTNAYIAGISGVTVPGGVGVIVNSSGHLGTTTSSARFKEAIKPMDQTSEAILALKPVTFHYKSDSKDTSQFGLIAEQVAEVNPDLVVRDKEGKPYSVRYEAVNAMLLNEFLKEHAKVEQLKKEFESKIAEQQKQIQALTAGLQKVSAQVEMSRPAPQVVDNRQ